ncbi:unnamed protein product [Lampetra fluviatilis]
MLLTGNGPLECRETNPPPLRKSAGCATEVPVEEAGGPLGRPAGTEAAPGSPTSRSALPGRIQEDVNCAFPGLDDEQL